MGITSRDLYAELEKTYIALGKTYEGVLRDYCYDQNELMKTLYVDNCRRVRGIIFVDGTYDIGSELLTEMFTKYSTVFVVCALLSPAERKQISDNDMNKVIKFENVSIMRYMNPFIERLTLACPVEKKRISQYEKIVAYDSTLYADLRAWLHKNPFIFRVVYSIHQLRKCLDS